MPKTKRGLSGPRPVHTPRYSAQTLTDHSSLGPVMLVKVTPPDGPEDVVAVNAYTEKEALKYVKGWLVSIDYDNFKGVKFKVSWLDIESITLLIPRGM